MPLQKLPTTALDDINHRRRARETINNILSFDHDDSRVRTDAEKLAGITPVNYAYEPSDVRRQDVRADGTTDDSPATQRALDANAGGYIEFVPGATHKFLSSLDATDVDLYLNGATLDFSGATISSIAALYSRGSIGSSLGGGLASNVAVGAFSATLNSAPSLSRGDLVVLRNPTDGSFNGARADYRAGEFLVVKGVSGAVVTFASATIGAYTTAASCTLHKVTPTRTRIFGPGKIIGNTSDTTNNLPTILIEWSRDSKVTDIEFLDTTGTCLDIHGYNWEVDHINTGKLTTDSGSIQASGLIGGGQFGRVLNSTLHGDRHGSAIGGDGKGYTVDRFITVKNCHLSSRTNFAADFHGGGEYLTYENCHVDGGANISGGHQTIRNCDISPLSGTPRLINVGEINTIDHTIEGNTLRMRGSSTYYILDASATTALNTDVTVDGRLRFHRNSIIDDSTTNQAYLNISNQGSTSEMYLSIKDNEVRRSDSSSFGVLLAVSVTSGDNFYKLFYENQEHVNTGFGTVAGVDVIRLTGSLGINVPGDQSPSFGTARFEPSVFYFDKRLDLGTPATAFTIITIPTANSFLPLAVALRVDVNVTATTGDFLSVGVNAANRRVDFGVLTTAAAASQHAKNNAMRFINSSEVANQMVDASEALALMSVNATTDAATIANNIGGASQTITVRVQGRMIGLLLAVP